MRAALTATRELMPRNRWNVVAEVPGANESKRQSVRRRNMRLISERRGEDRLSLVREAVLALDDPLDLARRVVRDQIGDVAARQERVVPGRDLDQLVLRGLALDRDLANPRRVPEDVGYPVVDVRRVREQHALEELLRAAEAQAPREVREGLARLLHRLVDQEPTVLRS